MREATLIQEIDAQMKVWHRVHGIFLIALDGRGMIGTPGVLLQHVKPEAGRLKNQSSKGNSRRRMKEPH